MTDAITAAHHEKLTLEVDVEIPAHVMRAVTPLFRATRPLCLAATGGRCFNCGRTEAEAGLPIEAHHHPVERCWAEQWDWPHFIRDARAGLWGPKVQAFDWDRFAAERWWEFVDDMTVNGMPLCKPCHIGRDRGIHELPFPLFVARMYLPDGYEFSPGEVIHHAQT
jgi:hypothetical protein